MSFSHLIDNCLIKCPIINRTLMCNRKISSLVKKELKNILSACAMNFCCCCGLGEKLSSIEKVYKYLEIVKNCNYLVFHCKKQKVFDCD